MLDINLPSFRIVSTKTRNSIVKFDNSVAKRTSSIKASGRYRVNRNRSNRMITSSLLSLLANPQILAHPLVKKLAEEQHGTPAQIFFRFLLDIGITPLTGTTDIKHMKEDIQVLHWSSLDHESVAKLKKLIHD